MLSLRLPSARALSGLWRLLRSAPGHRPLAPLLLPVLVLLMLLVGPARSNPSPEPFPLLLQQQLQAEFRKEGEVRWRPVTLPDSWKRRQEPTRGTGLYRIALPPSTAPAGADVALWIEHIPSRHRIRLNGHLLSDRAGQTRHLLSIGTTLVRLPPPARLQGGVDLLEIEVQGDFPRAGLGLLHIGPEDLLLRGPVWAWQQQRLAVQLVNAAASGIALFMLLLWAVRRHERALGCFGLLALLATLRNQAYFSTASPVPGALSSLLFYLLQLLTVVLLGHFVRAHVQQEAPRFRWLLHVGGSALALVGTIGILGGQSDAVRLLAYPVLIVMVLWSLALMVRHAPGDHPAQRALMPAGMLAVLVAGVHDYLYQTGRTTVSDDYWAPFAVPLIVAVFAAQLLSRLAAGLMRGDRDRLELERQVALRTAELNEAVQARSRFIASASHDLRQPMSALRMLAELLHQTLREPPVAPARTGQRITELASQIDRTSQTMASLLDGLLDLSRLEGRGQAPRPAAVPLQPLLRTVAADCDALAMARGLRLIVRPTAAVVIADALLLEQILRNLVGNAVQNTLQGGVLVGVRPHGRTQVRLVVIDTGPGLDPARLDDDAPGGGLGLGIVRRCARLMQAPLSLRSTPGRGSSFSLVLPTAALSRTSSS
ncbi:Signal transduction histidine kinase [Sphaerotilus natans]|nr:Signal transduction histidine kinase [Sphaerotilus natans]